MTTGWAAETLFFMAPPLLVTFAAGLSGVWRIDRIEAVIGSGLPPAERLAVLEGGAARGHEQYSLHAAAGARHPRRPGGSPRPFACDTGRLASDSQNGRMVGAGARRTTCHLRGPIAAYRHRSRVCAGRRAASAPLSRLG